MKDNLEKGIDITELTTQERFHLAAFLVSYKCNKTKVSYIVHEKPELPITVYQDWSNQIVNELSTSNVLKFTKLSKSDLRVKSYYVNVEHSENDNSLIRELVNPTITETNINDYVEIFNADLSFHICQILDDAFGDDKRSSNLERIDIFIRIGEILANPISIPDSDTDFDTTRKILIEKANNYYDEINAIVNELRSSGIVVNVRENSYTSMINKIIDESSKT